MEVHQRRADRQPVLCVGAEWSGRPHVGLRWKSWAGALGGYRLVLVNGAYAPQFSGGELPAGVHVSSLRSVLATNPAAVEPYLGRFAPPDRQAFTALNTGFLQDGAFVWIPPGTIVEQPILLLFVSVSHRHLPACRTRAF